MIANVSRFYVRNVHEGKDLLDCTMPLIPNLPHGYTTEEVQCIAEEVAKKILEDEDIKGVAFVGMFDFCQYVYEKVRFKLPCFAMLKVGKKIKLRRIEC